MSEGSLRVFRSQALAKAYAVELRAEDRWLDEVLVWEESVA